MKWLSVYLVALLIAVKATEADVIARPRCKDSCGNVTIPFPFGIGPDCFLDSRYEIECRESRPFLSKYDVEVAGIEAISGKRADCDGCSQTITILLPPLKMCTSNTKGVRLSSIDLRGSPYNFSMYGDIFLESWGCAGSIAFINQDLEMVAGCSMVCHSKNNTPIFTNESCYGVECCAVPLYSYGRSFSNPQIYHIDFYGQASSARNCLAATMIGYDHFVDPSYAGNRSILSTMTVPTVLHWSWTSSLWPESDPHRSLCHPNNATGSIKCVCKSGHFGNPYVAGGCQGDCNRCGERSCELLCNSNKDGFGVLFLLILLSQFIGVIVGPLLLVYGGIRLRRFIKRRRKTERRVKFFKLKLQEHQSSSEGIVGRTKLFTRKQLDKATNHFHENQELGRGGQGIVYKGILFDGRIVAIKQLKAIDESQIEPFINEVVVLSQIDHRNVVKLLGCCLETRVPLLVYEFVSNGTLSQLIHDPDEDFVLTWMMRMKIAVAAAQAVAYLHSYSSIPIYHRDIKSANILLDEKYRAKVSDFGSSKTIAMDQTHLTTLVQGTIGYLDPEYFRSNQYTDKSDVYSFGVVLLELLTRKKPNYTTETMEQKNLVVDFCSLMEKNQLSCIIDLEISKEAREEELAVVIELARRCLSVTGDLRPTMKEVAMTLEMIIKSPDGVPKPDEKAFPRREIGADEWSMTSDTEFKSNSLRVGATSSSVDIQPFLHDTI